MYRAGIASIFSKLVQDGRLTVVESLGVDAPRTKVLAGKLKNYGNRPIGFDHRSPVVDDNLWLSARNMHNVSWCLSRTRPIRSVWFAMIVF
jgi:large subunit ribosomal protein L4